MNIKSTKVEMASVIERQANSLRLLTERLEKHATDIRDLENGEDLIFPYFSGKGSKTKARNYVKDLTNWTLQN